MAEYKVQFEVFEGPLDLLLYLIKKDEVDIYEVNLTKLATQFIEYIDTMRLLDLEIAGEFLVMASTLMYIKSRELLPVEQQAQVEGEEEGEDPRWELIRQLVEYKKFKDAAAQLQTLEARQEHVFPRIPGRMEFIEPETEPARPDVSIFDLLNAVNSVLKRFEKREGQAREIFEDKWSVSEKIEFILKVIGGGSATGHGGGGSVKFSQLFENVASRAEVVCTFLALLELIRLKQLVCIQPEAFGEIEIGRAVAETAPSAMDAEAKMANQEVRPIGPEAEPAPAAHVGQSPGAGDGGVLAASPVETGKGQAIANPSEGQDEAPEPASENEDEYDDEDEDEDDEDDNDEVETAGEGEAEASSTGGELKENVE